MTKTHDKLDRLLTEARAYSGRLRNSFIDRPNDYAACLLDRLVATVIEERERANTATRELDEERYYTKYVRGLLTKAESRIKEFEKYAAKPDWLPSDAE
jgi:hypothetical protein